MGRSWKIEINKHYIRRRDKLLVQVTSVAGTQVGYVLKKTGVDFKVSTNGFRMGFRPATEEEMNDQGVL